LFGVNACCLMNGDYDQLAQQRQLQEELKIVHEAVSKIMDKKARERLANVKMVKPEMAMQLELYLYQLLQSGQLTHISDEQLIKILSELTKKREIRIKRK